MEFTVNAPFPEIRSLLGKASVGLSTMVDEHFGINVVEFMVSILCPPFVSMGVSLTLQCASQSAGLIPLVHASAGPLLDIVTPYDEQVTGEPDSVTAGLQSTADFHG